MAYQPYAPRGRGAPFRGNAHAHAPVFNPYGRGRGRGHNENAAPPRPQSAGATVPKAKPTFTFDGVDFLLIAEGRKLKRITPADEEKPSPLKAEIAGIKFYRTKNGNLLRHKEYLELEAKRCDKRWIFAKGVLTQDYRLAKTKLCPKFTRSGHCSDRTCTFIHDPNKISACKSFLFKGTCPAGDNCHLSHDLTPQRTTLCHFFARGCTNRNCRYAHYKPKDALICVDFATTGYCEAGTGCDHIHLFECPAFANTGNCDDEDCHLPHVRHARRLNGATSSAEPESNNHSEAEAEENVGFFVDVEKALPADTSATAFKEQEDFIRF